MYLKVSYLEIHFYQPLCSAFGLCLRALLVIEAFAQLCLPDSQHPLLTKVGIERRMANVVIVILYLTAVHLVT